MPTTIGNTTLYRREDLVEALGEHMVRRLVGEAGLRAVAGRYPDFAVEDAIRRLYTGAEQRGAQHDQQQPMEKTPRRATIRRVPAPGRTDS